MIGSSLKTVKWTKALPCLTSSLSLVFEPRNSIFQSRFMCFSMER